MSDDGMEIVARHRFTAEDVADLYGLEGEDRELMIAHVEERKELKEAEKRDREAFIAEMKKRADAIAAEITAELGGDLSVEFDWDAE